MGEGWWLAARAARYLLELFVVELIELAHVVLLAHERLKLEPLVSVASLLLLRLQPSIEALPMQELELLLLRRLLLLPRLLARPSPAPERPSCAPRAVPWPPPWSWPPPYAWLQQPAMRPSGGHSPWAAPAS